MAERPDPRAIAPKNPGPAAGEGPLRRAARLLTRGLPVVTDQPQPFIEQGQDSTDIRGTMADTATSEQEITTLSPAIRGQLGDGVKMEKIAMHGV